ncbi:ABC transporter transmembrane domain-containing protein [Alteribacillus iranensis]|uniref:ABC transporter transmembrane domain-containing protein n=1 Tax=Alteribacillus iranensis TaxID=930128 RepID=UPI0015A53821|nr:ABC transporter transmembrane domain-containing protein [Alteribacillus iranensis]
MFIGEVLVARDANPLTWIILTYFGLILLRGALYFSDTYLSNWVGENFVLSLRHSLFEYLQGLSLHFFKKRKLGDILSRLSTAIASIEHLVVSGATSAISYLFQLLVFVGMLFFMQWKSAFIPRCRPSFLCSNPFFLPPN